VWPGSRGNDAWPVGCDLSKVHSEAIRHRRGPVIGHSIGCTLTNTVMPVTTISSQAEPGDVRSAGAESRLTKTHSVKRTKNENVRRLLPTGGWQATLRKYPRQAPVTF
jgi:hypothetical protein